MYVCKSVAENDYKRGFAFCNVATISRQKKYTMQYF